MINTAIQTETGGHMNRLTGRKFRFGGLVVGAAAALLLTACGGSSGSLSSTSTAAASSAAASASASAEPSTPAAAAKVVFLNALGTDPFWRGAGDGAKSAAEAAGAEFVEQDANGDATAQASQLDTAVQQGANVIVIAPVDSKAITPQLNAATEAGVTVVALNRPISGVVLDGSVFISEYQGGVEAAEAMFAAAKEQGLSEMNVLQLRGATSDEAAQLRGSGFADTIKKGAPGITVTLIEKGTDWKPEQAASATEDVLSTQEIQGLYTESDFLLPSVIPVLERNGYTPLGGDKHAVLVGVGGLPDALKLIREGWQDATMAFPIDKQAAAAVRLGVALFNGMSAEEAYPGVLAESGFSADTSELKQDAATGPQIINQPELVTKANVDDPNLWGNGS